MKILISVDIEGASGIVSAREVGYPRQPVGDPQSNPDYLVARQWLTADVNAAVEGAIEAGATRFVLHDTHGLDYRNVVMDELHPAVEVVRGMPVIFYEYDDLDTSYDAAFLIALHSRAGTAGLFSHVLSWPLLRDVRLNGQPVGEGEITTELAAQFGIPTVLITGDNMVCDEMKSWTGGKIETAVVKQSLSRYAAHCLPLGEARGLIHQAAYRAVQGIADNRVSHCEAPFTIEVTLSNREIARYVAWMPGVNYDGDSTVSYTDDDFLTVYKAFLAMFWIALSGGNP